MKKYRMYKTLTIAELAKQLGIPKPTIRSWHTGRTTPRLKSHVRTLKETIPETKRFFKAS